MTPVHIDAPAKINLFLRIAGKRSDGYHELVSLMCPIGLYDVLTLSFGGSGVRVSCDHPDVPEDESNLTARAADLFMRTAFPDHQVPVGLHIRIDKKIPVGAGLGGGSSDAAAVLKSLNRQFGEPFASSALATLGGRIGADVPFFIHCVPALAEGIGDRLTPFAHLTPWTVLLVYPNAVVSTAWVYKNLNLRLTKDEKKLSNFHFNGRFFGVDEHLVNDLEPVTTTALPVIKTIKRLLLSYGASGALMSGSGPTVFGLFSEVAGAEKACDLLRRHTQSQHWTLHIANMLV